MTKPIVIAIDGPAASGKGTLARRLAAHYGFAHLDSGALYRAVALSVLESGNDPANQQDAIAAAEALDYRRLNDAALRTDAVGTAASTLAPFQPVRDILLKFQRDFAANPPEGAAGAVLDGRDIGTVICPDAPAKLFVVASAQARAQRRHAELTGKGHDVSYDDVLADLVERDERDTKRAAAPLSQANDALLLDTTKLDIEAAFEQALRLIDNQLSVSS